MLIFLHYYRKMKYFLFYNCLKASNNPACFGEGFTRSDVILYLAFFLITYKTQPIFLDSFFEGPHSVVPLPWQIYSQT
jgi:hypothetical protein